MNKQKGGFKIAARTHDLHRSLIGRGPVEARIEDKNRQGHCRSSGGEDRSKDKPGALLGFDRRLGRQSLIQAAPPGKAGLIGRDSAHKVADPQRLLSIKNLIQLMSFMGCQRLIFDQLLKEFLLHESTFSFSQ